MSASEGRTEHKGAAGQYLPTEVALLLLASGGDATAEAFERVARRAIDWPRLTRLAFAAHATPVVWRQLATIPGLAVPPEGAELQSLAVLNEFRLRHIATILADVVGQLSAAGIEVMLLKGAALLVGASSKPLQRTMGDLDLLVVKGSAHEAWRICRGAGWQIANPRTEEAYGEHHHFPPLSDPFGVQIALELHRSLFPPGNRLGVDESALIARGRRIHLGPATVIVPSHEDLLLHACLHFAWSHVLETGAWRTFADAHVITADPRFSWDKFLDLVRSTNGAAYCYWPLRLAEEGAGLRVPKSVLERLHPHRSEWMMAALERHFFYYMYDQRAATLPLRVNRLMWRLATRTGNGEPWKLGTLKDPELVNAAARASSGTPTLSLKSSIEYLLALLRPPHDPVLRR